MIDCVHVLVQEYETDSETDSSCSCNTKKFQQMYNLPWSMQAKLLM